MCLSVRVALTPPHAQMLEWKTSQSQELVPQKHAGSSPALCTTYTFLAQLVEQRTFNP